MTFKLVQDSNKELVTDNNDYARWLRVLGQELSALGFVCFRVELDRQVYKVQSEPRPQEENSEIGRALGESVKKAWSRLLNKGDETKDLCYTLDDLEVLDKKWMARRTGEPRTPDIHSLGEAFRTIGRFIDARSGRLLTISKEPRRIVVDFQERTGEKKTEEFLGFSLFKHQKKHNSDRRVVKDAWEGLDR